MSVRLRLATWNILATAYIRREYYPDTPEDILDFRHRLPRLVDRAEELDADILCLQEVERNAFSGLESRLGPLGYQALLAMKGGKKPDGCAVFFRAARCELLEERRLLYPDGAGEQPDSGHVAQFVALRAAGTRVEVVNTHLKWDPPGTLRDRQWGYRQASLILSALEKSNHEVQVVCGDFNVKEDSPVVRLFAAAGFEATHRAAPGVYSCNSNGEAKLIDYILYRGPVQAKPVGLPLIDGRTTLPSREHPSDHLALITELVLSGEDDG